jgi:hypothetical protein
MKKIVVATFIALSLLTTGYVNSAKAQQFKEMRQKFRDKKMGENFRSRRMNKKGQKLTFEQKKEKISTIYEKAVSRIKNNKKAPQDLKDMLMRHAKERKDLALSSLEKRNKMKMSQKAEREKMIKKYKSKKEQDKKPDNDDDNFSLE